MKMKKCIYALTLGLLFIACDKEDEYDGIAWNEAIDGELSGVMSSPTPIILRNGDNRIIGGSTPASGGECTTFEGGPPAPVIPYFPNHESYTDLVTFTLSANQRLVGIKIEALEVSPVYSSDEYPCIGQLELQAGAFTAINNSNQIDWNSDNVINFISLPVQHPLKGMGFAKSVGDDLLAKYRQDFPLPGYEGINTPSLDVSNGTYTFWWKEGQNQTSYTLNFMVDEID